MSKRLFALLWLCMALGAQEPPSPGVRYENATIQLSANSGKTTWRGTSSRWEARNASLRDLIEAAYQLRDFQIAGGPSWMDSAHFDVSADRLGTAAPQSFDAIGAMLQTLLQQQLHLVTHREPRELPVYSLTIPKGGAKIYRAHQQDCARFVWSRNPVPIETRWSPGYCGAAETGPNVRLNHTLDAAAMNFSGADSFIAFLSRQLDRPLIDRTGLTGRFDIRLEWNLEATAKAFSPDNESPSIFSAVEQQLGLLLIPGKAPVEVLVIDSARLASDLQTTGAH